MRAACFKHSDLQENGSKLPSEDFVDVEYEVSDANGLLVRLSENNEQNLKIVYKNGNSIGIASHSNPSKLSHHELEDGGMTSCRLTAGNMFGGNAEQQLCIIGDSGWDQ